MEVLQSEVNSKIADKKQISQEKQMRILVITSTLPFVALLVVGIYFLYLKTIGIEISEWLFISYIIFVGIVGFILSFTVNELLLKACGGEFKFKRLVFRWVLAVSYFSLIYGISFFLSFVLPWATAFWEFFTGALAATAVFLIIALKLRGLFRRLYQGEL